MIKSILILKSAHFFLIAELKKHKKIWIFEQNFVDFLSQRDLANMTKLCLLLGAIQVTQGLNNFNANAVRRKVFIIVIKMGDIKIGDGCW